MNAPAPSFPKLPESVFLIERGWLSANQIVLSAGDSATVIDSGYVSEARDTIDRLHRVLAGRRLERLIATHSHSDHIGGNAALKAAFACRIVMPQGIADGVSRWDEQQLLLSSLGQHGERFAFDDTIAAGETLEMGGLTWQALAVPGHDMLALAYYNPEKRLLISGDALWENGFGLAFPELLGEGPGLAAIRETLDQLARLPIDIVLPGHGAPFGDVDAAFQRAYARHAVFAGNLERYAWYGIKVIVAFAMLEKRRLTPAAFQQFVAHLPFVQLINRRFLDLEPDLLATQLEKEMCLTGVLRLVDGWLEAA